MPSVLDDALVVESVRFAAAPYLLEGELSYAEQAAPRGGAVVAGPHPLLGGTMANNVVTALADGLARRGVAALRFNYQGTGNSEGPPADVVRSLSEFWTTSHSSEESAYGDNLVAAATFLQETMGACPSRALIGYSFGCSLLPRAALIGTPLVLVAPTVGTHDYDAYFELSSPLLVIASANDFAANADRLQQWFDGLSCPRRLVLGSFDNHFFRGHEGQLAEIVAAFLDEQWRTDPCP